MGSTAPGSEARSPDPLRVGGRAQLPSGEIVVWSVADGRRGRRWREVTSRDGAVSRSLLIETDPAGRVVRLEIATAGGLLTLHPEGADGVLHGNVVSADGIRHLTMGEGILFVLGSPAAAAIGLGGLTGRVAVGASERVRLIRIDDRLDPVANGWDVSRVDDGTWRLVDVTGGEVRTVRLGDDGLVELTDGVRWPLEL